MNLGVAVQAEELTLARFGQKRVPGSVRAMPDVEGKGFISRFEVMKGQRRFVAAVTASLAPAALLSNQLLFSLPAALLLRDVILMPVVCRSVLASARAEDSLPAGKGYFADDADLFHTTFRVGLRAYHIRVQAVSGSSRVRP
ncbi:MAG: hypothetical protein JOZ96_15125 [Acidobacteria bacterium]|nr:hypothetical protein [Acidobacteriota bacterium]